MKHLLLILFVISCMTTCAKTISFYAAVSKDELSTIIVDQTVTSDGSRRFSSIQQAVNQANAGDIILVKKGTYHETVTIRTEGITIAAFDPSHPPVIDEADQTFGQPSWRGRWLRLGHSGLTNEICQKKNEED